MTKKPKKLALKCHQCGKKCFTKIEKPYTYKKNIGDYEMTFKAIGKCDTCGYVHGVAVDFKCG